MAKWTHIYQQVMKDAFDEVLKQTDTNTAEKLLSSLYDYNIHGLIRNVTHNVRRTRQRTTGLP